MKNEIISKSEYGDIINLRMVFQALKKYSILIIFLGVVGLLFSWILATFIITPKYESNVDILVNQKAGDIQNQLTMQQVDLQAINTYKDVLKKPIILNDVLKQLREQDNYSGNLEDLQNSLNVTNETNSQVITVTAKTQNPYIARDMANIVGQVFTKRIKKLMKVDNVTIVSAAQADTKPVSPNKKLIMILGVLAGVGIGMVISVVKELMKTTVDDVSYLTDDLGLTNLGSVYHINNGKKTLRVVKIVEVDDSKDQHRRI